MVFISWFATESELGIDFDKVVLITNQEGTPKPIRQLTF